MFDWAAKAVFELFAGTPEDKERAQEQLRPVLERRFQPCLELWQALWQFADKAQKGLQKGQALVAAIEDGGLIPSDAAEVSAAISAARVPVYTSEDIRTVSEQVDDFLSEHGPIVSVPTMVALIGFQKSLREFDPTGDELERSAQVSALFKQLFPSDRRDKNGNVVDRDPGLLMLLRDELGSNTKAASSRLK